MRNKKGGVKFFVLLAFIGLVFLGFTAYAAYTGKYTTGMHPSAIDFSGLDLCGGPGIPRRKGRYFHPGRCLCEDDFNRCNERSLIDLPKGRACS